MAMEVYVSNNVRGVGRYSTKCICDNGMYRVVRVARSQKRKEPN